MKIATSFLLCTYNLPHTIAQWSRQGPCRQAEGCCRFRFTDLGKQRTNQDGQHGVCNQQHGGPVLPIELFSVYSNNFWSKGEISTCSHVMAEISSLPSGVNEKYICRLSFVPITRSTRPLLSTERIIFELFDDVSPSNSPISPDERHPCLSSEQSAIPSFKEIPYSLSKLCSN